MGDHAQETEHVMRRETGCEVLLKWCLEERKGEKGRGERGEEEREEKDRDLPLQNTGREERKLLPGREGRD